MNAAAPRLAGAFLALIATINAPALAFDRLERAMTSLRVDTASRGASLFAFVGPPTFFLRERLAFPYYAGQIAMALPVLDQAMKSTGIDFSRAHGLIAPDLPTQTPIDVIVGDDAMTLQVHDVLQSRGHKASDERDFTVFSRFEDNEIRLLDRDPTDPFGGNFGAAQRIAVRPGLVLVARSWPVLRSALPKPGDACQLCPLFAPLIVAARDYAGPGARVLAASGHTLFSQSAESNASIRTLDKLLGSDPAKVAEMIRLEPSLQERIAKGLPPFSFALMIVSYDPAGSTFQVLALYPDTTSASKAASVLRDRIAAVDRGGDTGAATIARDVRPVSGGVVAAVLVRFAQDGGARAVREKLFWYQALVQRNTKFPLLNVPD